MFRCKKYILVLVMLYFPLLGGAGVGQAQTKTIDSLKLALKNAKHDTTRCNILNAMIEAENDAAIWPLYNEQLKDLAEINALEKSTTDPLRKLYLKFLSDALNNIGFLANEKADIPKALEYYNKSLNIQEEIEDKRGIANSFNNIGSIYKNQGAIPKSLEYFSKSLKAREEIGDKRGIAESLHNIGVIYESQGDIPKALEYYNKGLKIREDIGDKTGIALSLNNIGVVYKNQGDMPKALEYFSKSLKLREEIGNKNGIASSFNNIGFIYNDQGDIPKALEYFNKSLKMREDIGDKNGMTISLDNIAGIYLKQKNYNKALVFSLKALHLGKEIGYPLRISEAAIQLTKTYKAKGDYKNALANYELYILMRDSITNQETKKASIKNQLKYEYEKRAAADSVKNAEEQKVKDAQLMAQNAQIKQEKFQRYALIGGLVMVLVGLGFVINRFRITQRQKRIIEKQKIIVDEAFEKLHEKNKEILDSIRYAKRIQTALLPSEKYIERNLKQPWERG